MKRFCLPAGWRGGGAAGVQAVERSSDLFACVFSGVLLVHKSAAQNRFKQSPFAYISADILAASPESDCVGGAGMSII